MNTRTLIYAFLAVQGILAAAHNKPARGLGMHSVIDIHLEGADVHSPQDYQQALEFACQNGQLAVVKLLCALPQVDPGAAGECTPVREAVTCNHFALLRYMQTCRRSAEFIRPGSRLPIYHAMLNGSLESLVILMERDHYSHARLAGGLPKDAQMDVTRLSPDAVRACVAGDLEALKASKSDTFNSLDNIDVLLGLARHHPALVAFLKGHHHAYIRKLNPSIANLLITDTDYLQRLESQQPYGFLVARQLYYLLAHIGEALDFGSKPQELRNTIMGLGFKNIDQ